MDTCIICFESMDMCSFRDERDKTDSCFKLDCGHAYHTKCIITCLSQSNYKCPSCNKHKTPEQKLTHEGLVRRLIMELKKDDEIKLVANEFKEARDELSNGIQQLKKDLKEYVKLRSKELQIDEKRSYMLKCLAELRSKAIHIANKKGPQYRGAFSYEGGYRYWRGTNFERAFLGRVTASSLYRLKYPRYSANLY